jgi:hypothetical protein
MSNEVRQPSAITASRVRDGVAAPFRASCPISSQPFRFSLLHLRVRHVGTDTNIVAHCLPSVARDLVRFAALAGVAATLVAGRWHRLGPSAAPGQFAPKSRSRP